MRFRKCLPVVALIVLPLAAQSAAIEAPFVQMGGTQIWPASARGAVSGVALDAGMAISLAPSWLLEGQASFANFNTGRNGSTDYYRSAVDARVTYLWGTAAFVPYLSFGAGPVYNDVAGRLYDAFNLNIEGIAGAFSPSLGRFGLRLRAEIRIVRDSYAYQNHPVDVQAVVSLVVPLRVAAP